MENPEEKFEFEFPALYYLTVFEGGKTIPAAYRSYIAIYEEYRGEVRHPRLSAIKNAILDECLRDAIPFAIGACLLAPNFGILEKAMGVFVAGQIYIGASSGADSGFR